MAIFHIRVSPKRNSLTICDKPQRPGYTVQAESAMKAFSLVNCFLDGADWALEAALRGEITVHHRKARRHA